MRFKVRFRRARVDIARYRLVAHRHLSSARQEAGKQWVEAMVGAIATSIIPVWSGASAATFTPLARKLSFTLTIAPVTTGGLGIPEGVAKGGGKLTSDRNKLFYTFQYSTSLEHLIFNEFQNANQVLGLNLKRPGPYHFQETGAEVFLAFAQTVRLPNPFDSIIVRAINV